MESISIYADAGLRVLLSVVAVRAFPVAVVFAASGAPSLRDRFLMTALYGTVAQIAIRYSDFEPSWLVVSYGYLCAAGGIGYLLLRLALVRRASLLFALLFFVLSPVLLHLKATPILVLLGWEVALSFHSYAVDTAARPKPFLDYLAFLLVNPCLVYRQRGAMLSATRLHARGLLRVLGGLLALATSGAIGAADSSLATLVLGVAPGAPRAALKLVQLYLAQTGLAAVQIGLMRQLGWLVPERYDRPFLAMSPADFWYRWNTYIGSWARLYVFTPLVRAVRRHSGVLVGNVRRVMNATLVLVTFIAIGALHDIYVTLSSGQLSIQGTLWFCLNACILLAWPIVADAAPKTHRTGLSNNAARVGIVVAALVLVKVLP